MSSSTANAIDLKESFNDISQSGFILSGNYYAGFFQMTGVPSETTHEFETSETLTVSKVTQDQWLYGMDPGAGDVSVAIDSDLIS